MSNSRAQAREGRSAIDLQLCKPPHKDPVISYEAWTEACECSSFSAFKAPAGVSSCLKIA